MGGEGAEDKPVEPSVGSTIMEMAIPSAVNQPTDEIIRSEHETVADAPVKTETPKTVDPAKPAPDTREAAAALLNKYMLNRG